MSTERKNTPATSDKTGNNTEVSSLIVLVRTLVDTTWRMFVPPALGAVVGLQFETGGSKQAAVWGASIGLVLSGFLVWQQFRSVNGSKKK